VLGGAVRYVVGGWCRVLDGDCQVTRARRDMVQVRRLASFMPRGLAVISGGVAEVRRSGRRRLGCALGGWSL
jgi:hypothetical protein